MALLFLTFCFAVIVQMLCSWLSETIFNSKNAETSSDR